MKKILISYEISFYKVIDVQDEAWETLLADESGDICNELLEQHPPPVDYKGGFETDMREASAQEVKE